MGQQLRSRLRVGAQGGVQEQFVLLLDGQGGDERRELAPVRAAGRMGGVARTGGDGQQVWVDFEEVGQARCGPVRSARPAGTGGSVARTYSSSSSSESSQTVRAASQAR